MPNTLRTLALTTMLAVAQTATGPAAEREQVRMVINLISGVKMPFPEKPAQQSGPHPTGAARHQRRNSCLPPSR